LIVDYTTNDRRLAHCENLIPHNVRVFDALDAFVNGKKALIKGDDKLDDHLPYAVADNHPRAASPEEGLVDLKARQVNGASGISSLS
jgi:hypothetical protein